jgi:hypothetical protein
LRKIFHALREFETPRQQKPPAFAIQKILEETRVALRTCLGAAVLRAAITLANIVPQIFRQVTTLTYTEHKRPQAVRKAYAYLRTTRVKFA